MCDWLDGAFWRQGQRSRPRLGSCRQPSLVRRRDTNTMVIKDLAVSGTWGLEICPVETPLNKGGAYHGEVRCTIRDSVIA